MKNEGTQRTILHDPLSTPREEQNTIIFSNSILSPTASVVSPHGIIDANMILQDIVVEEVTEPDEILDAE